MPITYEVRFGQQYIRKKYIKKYIRKESAMVKINGWWPYGRMGDLRIRSSTLMMGILTIEKVANSGRPLRYIAHNKKLGKLVTFLL